MNPFCGGNFKVFFVVAQNKRSLQVTVKSAHGTEISNFR